MEIDLTNLPDDAAALKALVRALAGENAGLKADVKASALKIIQLEARIAKLRRMQFGQSSEKIAREIEQLELELDALHEDEAVRAPERPAKVQKLSEKPFRKPLPEHLPREENVHEPSCTCPTCGGQMRKLGEDVTEVLEYVPASFKVIRHVRPKLSCRICETIVQAPMPSLPIERGKPGPGLLAHVLVSKYADHLPLYRQSEIYAREGVDLERSTLADWVGRSAALLDPLVEALRRDVLASGVLHGDDTPVPVLAAGLGKTRTGRLWTYVRDGRPYGSRQPPAAVFYYSPDRKGEHPGQRAEPGRERRGDLLRAALAIVPELELAEGDADINRARTLQARRERSTQKVAVLVHDVEVRGRAKVDDHDRPAVPPMCRQRVRDAIRTDLRGVVHAQPDTGLDARPDHERRSLEVALRQTGERLRERWHDAADDERVELRECQVLLIEEAVDRDGELVLGAVMDGGQAPRAEQLGVLVDAEDDIGVADIHREHARHVNRSLRSRRCADVPAPSAP